MNKTNIEWCDYTLNPVVGCKRGCYYCYAEKLHTYRHNLYKKGKLQNLIQYAKPFNVIQFFPHRLKEPAKTKKSSAIFLGSMTDTDYWEHEYMIKTINMCADNLHHKFIFLTKDARVYNKYEFPHNCHLGLTLTTEKDLQFNYHNLCHKINKKFVSLEPLLGSFQSADFSKMDLVIIGAMTGENAIRPERKWVDSVDHQRR